MFIKKQTEVPENISGSWAHSCCYYHINLFFFNVKSDCYYYFNTAQLCSFHLQSLHDINDTGLASALHAHSLSQNQGLNLLDISEAVKL